MNASRELSRKVFQIIEEVEVEDHFVDVRLDPSDNQITAEIFVRDIPMAAVKVAPTEMHVDGMRVVADEVLWEDMEDQVSVLEEPEMFTDVIVEHFYADEPELGEADTYLSIMT